MKTLQITSQIVRGTYTQEQVVEMPPFDVHNFDFHASLDDDEPLPSEGED